jgi:hypothetical protein
VAQRFRLNGLPALEPRVTDAVMVSPETAIVHTAFLANRPLPQSSTSFHLKLPDSSAPTLQRIRPRSAPGRERGFGDPGPKSWGASGGRGGLPLGDANAGRRAERRPETLLVA